MLTIILLTAALVCFGLAAFNVGGGRLNLVAAGLALWVLTELLPKIGSL